MIASPVSWSGELAKTYKPCGACQAFVPADTGCKHYKPGQSVRAARQAGYTASGKSRARQREIEAEARARAVASVTAFLKQGRMV